MRVIEKIDGISEELLKSRLHPDILREIKKTIRNVDGLLELPEDLKNILVGKRITAFRHPEIEDVTDRRYKYKAKLSEKGEEKVRKEIAGFINSFYGKSNQVEVLYNSGTTRIKQFASILKEELGEKIKLLSIDENFGTINAEQFSDSKREHSVPELAKLNKFLIKQRNSNDYNHKILLLHSLTIPAITNSKETPDGITFFDHKEIKPGESVQYDINFNGKAIRKENAILEINFYNIDRICNILEGENKFKNIISDFRKGEIDYVQLQNSINFIFYNYQHLYNKYDIISGKNRKRIIEIYKDIDLLKIILEDKQNKKTDDFEELYDIGLSINNTERILKDLDKRGELESNTQNLNQIYLRILAIKEKFPEYDFETHIL